MATYHVYSHERLPDEAIREGFSWPGFVLGWFWALRKHLWMVGVTFLAAEIILVGGYVFARAARSTLLATAILLAAILLRAFIGLRGTYWRENSMGSRGFQFAESVQADDAALAVARALRISRTSTAVAQHMARAADGTSGAGADSAARTSITGGQERAHTFSEIDYEKLGLAPASSAGASERRLAIGDTSPGMTNDGTARAAARKPGKKMLAFAAAALVLVIAGALVIWSEGGRREVAARSSADVPGDEDAAAADAVAASAPVIDAQPRPDAEAAMAPSAGTGPLPANAAPAPAGSQGSADATQATPGPTAGPPVIGDRSPAAKAAAWERYYKQPSNCVNPKDWEAYVECVNQRIRARDAFEQKWRSGELR